MVFRVLAFALFSFLSLSGICAATSDIETAKLSAFSYSTPAEKEDLFRELNLTYTDHNLWHPYLSSPDLRHYLGDELVELVKSLGITEISEKRRAFTLSAKHLAWAKENTPRLHRLLDDHGIRTITLDIVEESAPDTPAYLEHLSIKRTPKIGGFGVFAKTALEDGQFLGEYNGQVGYGPPKFALNSDLPVFSWLDFPADVTHKQATAAASLDLTADQSYNLYYLEKHPIFYQRPERLPPGSFPANLTISARTHRNEIAFINHSNKYANADVRTELSLKGFSRDNNFMTRDLNVVMAAYTVRSVEKGQQILFNYGYDADSFRAIGKTFVDLHPNDDRGCFTCGDPFSKHLRCTQCQKAFYCSTSCQGIDWSHHKERCIAPTKATCRKQKKKTFRNRRRH